MTVPIYQIDAFASEPFKGNSAAVCPLEEWLSDDVMQNIAMENNLAETAFFVKNGESYDLRWFTPVMEVDLCGHATLASAFVIYEYLTPDTQRVRFRTKSGLLEVKKEKDLLAMFFPVRPPESCTPEENLFKAFNRQPDTVLKSRDYFLVYHSEETIRSLDPDMELLSTLDCLGTIVTAPGDASDFVSRFFAPGAGIPEDPVTGSAHCTLIPYWAEVLGKKMLHAFQVSKRGGELFCEDMGDRVKISGKAVTFLTGTITIR